MGFLLPDLPSLHGSAWIGYLPHYLRGPSDIDRFPAILGYILVDLINILWDFGQVLTGCAGLS